MHLHRRQQEILVDVEIHCPQIAESCIAIDRMCLMFGHTKIRIVSTNVARAEPARLTGAFYGEMSYRASSSSRL